MNVVIRRIVRLIDEVPILEKLTKKKVKVLSKEDLANRWDMVLALPERIQAIPDGTTTYKSQTGSTSTLCVCVQEMVRHIRLMDEIDKKVDKVTTDIRNTNVRLKQTLIKMRSTRNILIDIILICVLLGIASYKLCCPDLACIVEMNFRPRFCLVLCPRFSQNSVSVPSWMGCSCCWSSCDC